MNCPEHSQVILIPMTGQIKSAANNYMTSKVVSLLLACWLAHQPSINQNRENMNFDSPCDIRF